MFLRSAYLGLHFTKKYILFKKKLMKIKLKIQQLYCFYIYLNVSMLFISKSVCTLRFNKVRNVTRRQKHVVLQRQCLLYIVRWPLLLFEYLIFKRSCPTSPIVIIHVQTFLQLLRFFVSFVKQKKKNCIRNERRNMCTIFSFYCQE